MNASSLETLTSLSTFAAAVATIAAVICAWKQLRKTLPHLEEQREQILKQQRIEIRNQKIAIRHQQNSVVMRLWENWDSALNYGTTRDDLLRFTSWIVAASGTPDFNDWIEFFAKGHGFDNGRRMAMLSNPPIAISEKFDIGDDGLTIEDIARIRASLNRFLNMVEQAAVAFTEKFGNVRVMNKCMIPTLQRYSGILLPYMNEVRKTEKETWTPIYDIGPKPIDASVSRERVEATSRVQVVGGKTESNGFRKQANPR